LTCDICYVAQVNRTPANCWTAHKFVPAFRCSERHFDMGTHANEPWRPHDLSRARDCSAFAEPHRKQPTRAPVTWQCRPPVLSFTGGMQCMVLQPPIPARSVVPMSPEADMVLNPCSLYRCVTGLCTSHGSLAISFAYALVAARDCSATYNQLI